MSCKISEISKIKNNKFEKQFCISKLKNTYRRKDEHLNPFIHTPIRKNIRKFLKHCGGVLLNKYQQNVYHLITKSPNEEKTE